MVARTSVRPSIKSRDLTKPAMKPALIQSADAAGALRPSSPRLRVPPQAPATRE